MPGGRICWLLSEILFFRPKMNKQKSDLALKKAVSYVMRRMCQPVWFHIHLPEMPLCSLIVRPFVPRQIKEMYKFKDNFSSIHNKKYIFYIHDTHTSSRILTHTYTNNKKNTH